MKVILRQDVESLGKMGDVIRVAEGYARIIFSQRDSG